MKLFFTLWVVMLTGVSTLLATTPKITYQNVSQEKMREQNSDIARLAAAELSKKLPQKIDKYTTLKNIHNQKTTLIYTFVINIKNKSDKQIQKEDHSRMQKAVTQGVCQSSKRFLQAGINISYIYLSAKSNKTLFRFDITKEKCNYPPSR